MPSATAALLGRAQRARAAPGDLLQRQPQRLGVGEFAVEQGERGLQRRQLLVGEGDRRAGGSSRAAASSSPARRRRRPGARRSAGCAATRARSGRRRSAARTRPRSCRCSPRRRAGSPAPSPAGAPPSGRRSATAGGSASRCPWPSAVKDRSRRRGERAAPAGGPAICGVSGCFARADAGSRAGRSVARRGARRTRRSRSRGRNATTVLPGASSFSRRSKLPSRPPRLSIMCTSVASRVQGTTGLPCSSVPWWERMMWPTRLRELRPGSPSMSSIMRRIR